MAAEVLINGKSVIDAKLDIEQEQIDVTTSTESDPEWSLVDAAGHIHAYGKDFTLPTLKWVERFVPCECCTDQWHQAGYSVTDYHCVICGERVVPGSRPVVGQRFRPGRYSWRVQFTAGTEDVLRLDHQRVSVWFTEAGKLKAFGVGQLAVRSISPPGIATGLILGAGELGQR